ncbi:TetR-type transcriptional regulator [Bifidobacterium ramosum]|uniref:TetR family transcriptional regulator n=1 Tax=Bifidobacterium ramosum TaxID=1798158 RepID=A0A6L4X183_9BIFI|nr:TetR/AcrR family transcriptional regulator [Bifidobacterium ramosum]KAB8288332.1 TetR-type transcriptional regulator [Bifidobacterium ramosum]NEG71631.1 TetR family transcriptional regulator [Bifidobacterium ramosum]
MTASTSSATPPRATRTREATDRKITQATLDILVSDGIGAMTIEEVSRRSGVAKTTIYRRYRNTDDLLHHLQIEAVHLPEFGHLDTTRAGLQTLLERVAASFNDEIGLKAVGAVLSTSNQAVHGLARQIIDPAQQRFAQFIARGVEAGAFRSDADARFLFDTTLGSMLAAKALTPDAAGDWPERMTALLWPAIARS